MKILTLRFKNLNSLQGEWLIDFQHPAYVNEGIFSITGATGAGKSTILDAICLALYGATPRLGNITENKNDIMSRQTGECFSEVTFLTNSGIYRCHWGQNRARKSPTGKLQPPKHEIAIITDDPDHATLIEEKASLTKGKVESITGMDFQRFTRAMLLAQGSFSAFLQANSDERSPILEQITGTEIYSEISKKVHEMRKLAEIDLKQLTDQLSGTQTLTTEQQSTLQQQQRQLEQQQQQDKNLLEQLQTTKIWRNHVNLVEQQLYQAYAQQQQITEQIQLFEPEQQRLNGALQALTLAGDYQNYQQSQQQLAHTQQQQQQLQQQHPTIYQQVIDYQQDSQQKQDFYQQQEITWQQLQPILKNVRKKDIHLQQLQTQIEQTAKQLSNNQQQIETHQTLIQQQQQQLQQYQQDSQVLQQNPNIGLFNQLPQILTNIQHWQQQWQDIEQEQGILQQNQTTLIQQQQQTQQKLHQLQQQKQQHQQEIANYTTNVEQLNQQLQILTDNQDNHHLSQQKDQLWQTQHLLTHIQQQQQIWQNQHVEQSNINKKLQELQQQQQENQQKIDNLSQQQQHGKEKVYLLNQNLQLIHKIANLEAERQQLQQGKPCPLCGSTEHPFANHTPMMPDNHQQDLIKANEQLEIIQQQLQDCFILQHSIEKDQQQLIYRNAQLQQLQYDLTHQMLIDCQNLPTNLSQYAMILAWWQSFQSAEQSRFADNFGQLVDLVQQQQGWVTDNLNQLQQRLQAIDTIQQQRQQQQEIINHYQQQLQQNEQNLSKLQAHAHYENEQWQQLNHSLSKLHHKQQQISHELQTLLSPYQILSQQPLTWQTLADIEQSHQNLQQLSNNWQQQQQQLQNLQTLIGQQQQQLITLQAEQQNLLKNNQQQSVLLQQLQGDYQQLFAERWQLFADKQPDDEENLANQQKTMAYQSWQTALQQWQNSQQQLIEIDSRLDTLANQYQQWKNNVENLWTKLYQQFQLLGFGDEAGYLKACLTEDERQKLQQKSIFLQQQQQIFSQKIVENQQLQQQYQNQSIVDELRPLTLDELSERLENLQQQFNERQEQLGGIRQQLANHAKIEQQQQQLLQKIDQQRTVFSEWDTLYQLIGSSDGKKFRNFAQGLTFQVMISHANEQLQKMTDRYLLLADKEQPLMLNVLDNYQGGEVRTSKNLSGGESFIVSLALALGLSAMASQRMQVNSLFLDEGFGTLDDDALDVALNTLTTLQQSGKLIGVISHIQALKERISSQIQVVPKSGGISQIVGFGVTKVG